MLLKLLLPLPLAFTAAVGLEPYEIRGTTWEPLNHNMAVSDLQGVVTASWSRGFWIRGNDDGDDRTSNSVYIECDSNTASCQKYRPGRGQVVSITGKVDAQFRIGDEDLYSTRVLASDVKRLTGIPNRRVNPIVLGQERSPPTELMSWVDEHPSNPIGSPNVQTFMTMSKRELEPEKYGLDFWRSLESELVLIKNAVAVGIYSKRDRGVWIHGDWEVTSKNSRGGLTMTMSDDGILDSNPEAIFLADRTLDGKTLPEGLRVGTTFSDITGIIAYRDGSYKLLPLTVPTIGVVHVTNLRTSLTHVPLSQRTKCEGITAMSYNTHNLNLDPNRIHQLASQIVATMVLPDIIFLQEIENDNNQGIVSSKGVLQMIVDKLQELANVPYDFVLIEPPPDRDGLGPAAYDAKGRNRNGFTREAKLIRSATLYRTDTLELVKAAPGNSKISTEAVMVSGQPSLNYNPGFIKPLTDTFRFGRRPLAALFQSRGSGRRIWTINLHLQSKGSFNSFEGNARPPPNGGLAKRSQQTKTVAKFVSRILRLDLDADIIVGGDFNEIQFAQEVFSPLTDNLLHHATDLAGVPYEERYTYTKQMNSQQLDHMLVSSAIARSSVEFEIMHFGTWAANLKDRFSDHDPIIIRWKSCQNGPPKSKGKQGN